MNEKKIPPMVATAEISEEGLTVDQKFLDDYAAISIAPAMELLRSTLLSLRSLRTEMDGIRITDTTEGYVYGVIALSVHVEQIDNWLANHILHLQNPRKETDSTH